MTAFVRVDLELLLKAAEEYGTLHGYVQRVKRGNHIYREQWPGWYGPPVASGWFDFWCQLRREIENWYTATQTACSSFDGMVNSPWRSYRPSLTGDDWRVRYLANAYDVYQHRRGDPRRAFRGKEVAVPPTLA